MGVSECVGRRTGRERHVFSFFLFFFLLLLLFHRLRDDNNDQRRKENERKEERKNTSVGEEKKTQPHNTTTARNKHRHRHRHRDRQRDIERTRDERESARVCVFFLFVTVFSAQKKKNSSRRVAVGFFPSCSVFPLALPLRSPLYHFLFYLYLKASFPFFLTDIEEENSRRFFLSF